MSQTATFRRRFAALCYESLLLAAISCLTLIPAALLNMLLQPYPNLAKLAISLCFLGIWWLYFALSMKKQGQTLPMRVWHLHLIDQYNQTPTLRQLRLRFMWSVVWVVFVPLCAYWALRQNSPLAARDAMLLALLWWLLPWGFALVHPSRQFLYDFLAGTRLVHQRQ